MTIIEGKRYDLSKLYSVPGAETRENHGLSREGVWITKFRRVIVRTYSKTPWYDGTCEGRSYHFADADEIAELATELGDERLLVLSSGNHNIATVKMILNLQRENAKLKVKIVELENRNRP